MARRIGTDRIGYDFSESTKLQVWRKGQIIPGVDPTLRRKDSCGATIEWIKYGNTTENGTGWEIDHIQPVSKGGGDNIENLQPLQWQNNRSKGDNYPASNFCVVSK